MTRFSSSYNTEFPRLVMYCIWLCYGKCQEEIILSSPRKTLLKEWSALAGWLSRLECFPFTKRLWFGSPLWERTGDGWSMFLSHIDFPLLSLSLKLIKHVLGWELKTQKQRREYAVALSTNVLFHFIYLFEIEHLRINIPFSLPWYASTFVKKGRYSLRFSLTFCSAYSKYHRWFKKPHIRCVFCL